MKITILTLFDEFVRSYINTSIIKNAIKHNDVKIEVINFREFSKENNKSVDDYQYGGGPGMVLMLQPIVDAINSIKDKNSYKILLNPKGKILSNESINALLKQEHIILIAGHYEGVDERIQNFIDDNISIGDYVLTGGELPALVLLDTIVRKLPGVINQESLICESFNNNLLDYPVYTKPRIYNDYKVPEILLSGDHKKIDEYRKQQQIEITLKNRPDLYKKYLKSKENKNGKIK